LQIPWLSIAELRAVGLAKPTDHLLQADGYPRIHADRLDPKVALADYFTTYVERDHDYREGEGLEVDLVVEQGMSPGELGLVEVKSGMTLHESFLKPLHQVADRLGSSVTRQMLLYGGDQIYRREGIDVVGLQAPA